MQQRIERVEIKKLFGRFDYFLDLNGQDHGISILTAPNGYGKSTILKIIRCFASGDYYYFIRERFESIKFFISNNLIVEILHVDDDAKKKEVTIRCGNLQTKIKDPFQDQNVEDKLFVIEKAFPFLTRIGQKNWRHDQTGEIFDKFEILTRYGGYPGIRRKIKKEDWLEDIRKSLKVLPIPTDRLKADKDEEFNRLIARPGSSASSLMVSSIARDIQERIQSAIRNQFEVGRKKETSFPTRLIEALRNEVTLTKESIFESIESVQEVEERYGSLGLLPHTGTTKQLAYHTGSSDCAGTFETAGMLVLKTYLDDVREKFSLLEDLAKKLDVFCTSISTLITFKSIETSADEGIIVRVCDGAKEPLTLSVLSSGEQHLIVLIGKLVFHTDPGTLVLIDEPEISFHPEWQEKFLSILEDIRSVNGFSALVATHSPILIGDRWDNVVELAEQYGAPLAICTEE